MLHALDISRDITAPRSELRSGSSDHAIGASIDLSVTSDLASIKDAWRAFGRIAEGTAFQAFDWLEPWQTHVGAQTGVIPVIVTGRFPDSRLAFILPLAIECRRFVRRLVFLGRASCDYNAPLLAPDFARLVPVSSHLAWWRAIRDLLARSPDYR